jgi:hypothetical protein
MSIIEQIAIVLLVAPLAVGFFSGIWAIEKRIQRKRSERRRADIVRAFCETSNRPQPRLVKMPLQRLL